MRGLCDSSKKEKKNSKKKQSPRSDFEARIKTAEPHIYTYAYLRSATGKRQTPEQSEVRLNRNANTSQNDRRLQFCLSHSSPVFALTSVF